MKRPQTLQKIVDDWNASNAIGRAVIYHPIIGEPEGKQTKTRGAAFVLSGHTPAIFVEGVSGCVALEAITLAN